MKNAKRIISLFLAILIFITFTSCKESEKKVLPTPEVAKDEELTLLYSKTDSLNPYAAKSELNRRLATLLFDPLYKYDSEYKAHPCIALSAEQQGNSYTVRIKDIAFTDGSPVTASDVLYSLNLARGSASSGFASTLSVITGASLTDSYTITFNLSRSDPYFLNLLTFPILKENTAGRTDSDGVEIPPIGSGRYTADTESSALLRNDSYFDIKSVVSKINLISVPDSESAAHYVQMGSADLYYTGSDSNIVRMSGSRYEIDINHLVFIGINSTYGALESKEMRYAISSAIDRSSIVDSAFYNAASVASGFFNPAFSDVKSTSTLKQTADIDISIENLAKIGYTIKDEDGYYISAAGIRAGASLLVNADNASRVAAARLISANAKAAGIEITVEAVPFDTYKSRLAAGSFQLYLGEIAISPDMDIKSLVVPGGSAAYGVSEPAGGSGNSAMSVSGAVAAYESGQIGISALSGVLLTEMPQIPICYKKGFLFYSDKIKSGVAGLSCDIYYSIASYKF